MKMKKLWRSRKALSPVIAAIILIAVTVAVSIAVAAWMGALTFTFMKTESIEWPTSVTFGGSGTTIDLALKNTGSADLYINVCKVNGVEKSLNVTTPVKIATGSSVGLRIADADWSEGYSYEIRFVATSGTEFAKTYVAS